jgi:hypothetical protein
MAAGRSRQEDSIAKLFKNSVKAPDAPDHRAGIGITGEEGHAEGIVHRSG